MRDSTKVGSPMSGYVASAFELPRWLFSVAALALASAVASAQTGAVRLPAPTNLTSCKDDDPVALAEKRVAPAAGAEYLACFASKEKVTLHGPSKTLLLPIEHAVALGITGGAYTRLDLDNLLSKVREQWQGFDPLSAQHKDYVTRINSLIQEGNSDAHRVSVDSVKPVLVAIDRLDEQSYAVVSIREYAITVDGEQARSIKTNAAAVVLQGTRLIRLEIIRELHAPSDVDEVRKQIATWSHAVAAGGAR